MVLATLKTLASSPINDIMIQSFADILCAYFKSKHVNTNEKDAWVNDMVVLLEKASKSYSIISIIQAIIQANQIGERGTLTLTMYTLFWKKLTLVMATGNPTEERHHCLNIMAVTLQEAHIDKVKLDHEFILFILAIVKEPDMRKPLYLFLYQIQLTDEWSIPLINDKGLMSTTLEGITSLERTNELVYAAFALHLIMHDLNRIPKLVEVRQVVRDKMGLILNACCLALKSENEVVFLQGVHVLSLAINSHVLEIDEFITSACIGILKEVVQIKKENSALQILWNQVLKEFLPLKFSIEDKLCIEDKITSTFYDAGKLHNLQPLPVLKSSPLNLSRETILVDLVADEKLLSLIEKSRKCVSAISHAQTLTNLALFVTETMGGPVTKKPWNAYKLSISTLKKEKKHNVIMLGDITCGTYYHRALLLKVLCDQLDIMAELNRGVFPVTWNVCVREVEKKGKGEKVFEKYVLDLMKHPGKLYPLESEESNNYIQGIL